MKFFSQAQATIVAATSLAIVAAIAVPAAAIAQETRSGAGSGYGSVAFYDVTSGAWIDPASGGVQVGDTIRTFYQGVLGKGAAAALGLQPDLPGDRGAYEITAIANFDQRVETVGGLTGFTAQSIGGGSFGVYFDTNRATFANVAAGTGFADGRLLASGTITSGALGGNTAIQDISGNGRVKGSSSFVADLVWSAPNIARSASEHRRGGLANVVQVDLALNYGCEHCTAAQTEQFFGTFVPSDNVLRAHAGFASAVPELSTYALLLGGLALVGGIARRRTRQH
jgi:hypothetical protein